MRFLLSAATTLFVLSGQPVSALVTASSRPYASNALQKKNVLEPTTSNNNIMFLEESPEPVGTVDTIAASTSSEQLSDIAKKDFSVNTLQSVDTFRNDRNMKVKDVNNMISMMNVFFNGLKGDLAYLEDRCIVETLRQLRVASSGTFKKTRDIDHENRKFDLEFSAKAKKLENLRVTLAKVKYQIQALNLQIQLIRESLKKGKNGDKVNISTGGDSDKLQSTFENVCCAPAVAENLLVRSVMDCDKDNFGDITIGGSVIGGDETGSSFSGDGTVQQQQALDESTVSGSVQQEASIATPTITTGTEHNNTVPAAAQSITTPPTISSTESSVATPTEHSSYEPSIEEPTTHQTTVYQSDSSPLTGSHHTVAGGGSSSIGNESVHSGETHHAEDASLHGSIQHDAAADADRSYGSDSAHLTMNSEHTIGDSSLYDNDFSGAGSGSEHRNSFTIPEADDEHDFLDGEESATGAPNVVGEYNINHHHDGESFNNSIDSQQEIDEEEEE